MKSKILVLTGQEVKDMSEQQFKKLIHSGQKIKIASHEVKIRLDAFIPLNGYELQRSDIIGE